MPAPPQASLTYRTPVMNPYCAMGLNHTSRDALYIMTQSMIYAAKTNMFPGPLLEQPLCSP
ncbi:hypothetical protein ACS0TY_023368 [Phlomoides rotata]